MSERLQKRGMIWYAVYYDKKGRRKKVSTKCTDKEAARAVLHRFEQQIHGAIEGSSSVPEDTETDKVYFVRSGTTGPIKIGVAKNLSTRLCDLQTGNPETIVLLAWVPGGRALEAELHHQFSGINAVGEWFHPRRELLERISMLTTLLRGTSR